MKRLIDKCGRISIPVEYRKELGLDIGVEANIEIRGKQIIITNPAHDDIKGAIIDKLEGLICDNMLELKKAITLIEEYL